MPASSLCVYPNDTIDILLTLRICMVTLHVSRHTYVFETVSVYLLLVYYSTLLCCPSRQETRVSLYIADWFGARSRTIDLPSGVRIAGAFTVSGVKFDVSFECFFNG